VATRLPPVAFLQALRVLLATPRLAPPGGESGRIGADGPDALRIIGVGDSIIAGTGVQQLRDSLTAAYARLLHARAQRPIAWQVRGRNGATSASVLRELVPTVPAADLYLISVGVNDVTRRVAAGAYGRNVAGIHERLRERAPASAFLFAGVPPLERRGSATPLAAARASFVQTARRPLRAVCRWWFPFDRTRIGLSRSRSGSASGRAQHAGVSRWL